MAAGKIKKVIVVGAGPVGLITAYILGKQNIAVDVLERGASVDTAPRALAYGLAAVRVIQKADLLDKIFDNGGFEWDTLSFRDIAGNVLASRKLPGRATGDDPAMLVFAVGDLSKWLVQEMENVPSVRILWSQKVTSLGQDEKAAWVEVEGNDTRLEADFVVGCDGGSSAVRRGLYGHDFPGYTWLLQMVAINCRYDMTSHARSDLEWIVDPDNWALVAKLNKEGILRIAIGAPENATIDEIHKSLPDRLRIILPGNPEPDQYEILACTPYHVHQRLVKNMRVGRVLLAGDAAHLNNPMGGLGLTTGVADVGALTDCLIAINNGITSLDILDQYDELRRAVFHNVTDAVSTANLNRVRSNPDGLAESDPFFAMLHKANTSEEARAQLHKMEMSLSTDMTPLIESGEYAATGNA